MTAPTPIGADRLDNGATQRRRAEQTERAIQEYAQRIVANWRPPTPEEREHLTRLLTSPRVSTTT